MHAYICRYMHGAIYVVEYGIRDRGCGMWMGMWMWKGGDSGDWVGWGRRSCWS
jgi:hypothetical protein